jgi:hypothetical protein
MPILQHLARYMYMYSVQLTASRDLCREWGAQRFPTHEVDFPSQCTQRVVLKYWNMSIHVFPPPEEPAVDNPPASHTLIYQARTLQEPGRRI